MLISNFEIIIKMRKQILRYSGNLDSCTSQGPSLASTLLLLALRTNGV
jgi:hypothetical protein